jgi:hypothetical protein
MTQQSKTTETKDLLYKMGIHPKTLAVKAGNMPVIQLLDKHEDELNEYILSIAVAIQTQFEKTKEAETQATPHRQMAGVAKSHQLRGVGRGLVERRDGYFAPKNEFIWIGAPRNKAREFVDETKGMFEDAKEKDYENDKDTSVYLELFGDVYGEKFPPNPDWFGANETYFFPWNLPKGYWGDRKYFNENDRKDVELVHSILNDRGDFFDNAPPKVYRCWRAATILANECGIGSLTELRKCGYTDEHISSLCQTKYLTYSGSKIMLRSSTNPDFYQLHGHFW